MTMAVILSSIGALGGLTAFMAFMAVIVKGIFAQTNATKDNTSALRSLEARIENLDGKVDGQGERIASLEGWRRRRALYSQSLRGYYHNWRTISGDCRGIVGNPLANRGTFGQGGYLQRLPSVRS